MIEFTPEIEKKIEDKIDSIIEKTFLRSQRAAYKGLLRDIEKYKYTTMSDIIGAIQTELDSLDKVEKNSE
jgi:hypothetical protein